MKKLTLLLVLALTVISCQNAKKEIITNYSNGKPLLAYYIKDTDGKKERVKEEMYYENEKTRYIGNFKNNKPSGKWQYFYDNGTLFAEADFDEKTANEPKNWKFYTPDDKPLIADIGTLKVSLSPDKSPATIENTKGGTTYILFLHPNFALKGKGTAENGIQTGKWTYWFPNGNLQTEGTYASGVLEGEQTVYRENGVPYYKGSYKTGVRVGIWEFFDENGTVIRTEDFKD